MNLYEQDFYAWTENQATALHNKDFKNIDIENLIEEVNSLGRSEKRTLRSYLIVLLTHLLKIKYQSYRHTNSWNHSVKFSRKEIYDLLIDNPSLKPKLNEFIENAYSYARSQASEETGLQESVFPENCEWDLEYILGENNQGG